MGSMDWVDRLRRDIKLAVSSKCGSGPSGFHKCGKFLDYLRNCYLLQRDTDAWSWLVR